MSNEERFVRFARKTGPFVVARATAQLPKARTLDVSAPLTLDDDGPGGALTLGVQGASSGGRGAVKLTGQLGGSADAPDVRGIRIPSGDVGEGPQLLAIGNVRDGEALVRSSGSLIGAPLLPITGGTLTGALDLGGHAITHLAAGVGADDAATFGQLTSMLNGLDWQASVLRADLNAVPTSPAPTAGDRFLVAAGASGSPWGGHVGQIAVFGGGTSWSFITPTKGTTVHVDGGTGGGTDLTFDGTTWVNIGASVDHNATLNRSADDAHSQYQLASAIDTNGGYAGLDGNGLVNRPVKTVRRSNPDVTSPNPGDLWVNGVDLKYRNDNGGGQTEAVERQAMKDQNGGYAGLDGGIVNKPVRAIRTGSDPGSPTSGDVWVNGGALKYRDASGSPATQMVEVQANRDQNGGYAGLDGGGLVNRPVKAVRTSSPDPGSPSPGDLWVNGTDLKFRDNGGSPRTRTVVSAGRQILSGAGIAGGGDLSADRTVSISAFSGVVSKDFDPPSLSWTAGETKVEPAEKTHICAKAPASPPSRRAPPSAVVGDRVSWSRWQSWTWRSA